MKFSMKSLMVRVGLGLGVVLSALALAVAMRQHRTFEAPFPAIQSSRDPAVIERGRYLALGAAHCTACHGASQAAGTAPVTTIAEPLSGGHAFELPVGVFCAPNITPDRETGIGRYKDAEIARMLRYGVRPNGEALLPFMPFQNLSDEDLTALISFLRSQPAVKHAVPEHAPNLLGRIVKAFMLTPRGPTGEAPTRLDRRPSAAYGAYLANSVANCVGCHTKMDLHTGELIGPKFAGGAEHPSHLDPRQVFVTPNLTPDPRWGWLQGWSEDAFVTRLRAGRVHAGSPMPWEQFSTISEDDARSLYRYFQSLTASPGGPDPRNRSSVERAIASR
jgi:mono/diheme cytochrome c family protein